MDYPGVPVRSTILSNLRISTRGHVKRRVSLLVIAICVAYSMLFFVDRIWAPGKSPHSSDLYPRWYGTRELLLRGRDPYGSAVSQEIQVWRYGHSVSTEQGRSQPNDENRFAYPLYIIFVLAPFVRLSFHETYELLRVVLPVISVATTLFWMRAIRWKCDPVLLSSIVLLSTCNFQTLESIYLQQPVLLAMAFLAGSCAALAANRPYVSGALLALATIKPQVSVLFALWVLFWACFAWRRQKGLVIGFLVGLSLLIGGSELLLRGWILEFCTGLVAYQRYTGTISILTFAFGRLGGPILSLGLLLTVSLLAWQTRCESFGSPRFYFTCSSVLVVMLVIAPTMYPTGQIALLPVILWTMKNSAEVWAEGRWVRLIYVSALCLIAWPWFGSLFVLALHRVVPIEALRSAWFIVLAPILLVPVAFLLLLTMRARTNLGARFEVACES